MRKSEQFTINSWDLWAVFSEIYINHMISSRYITFRQLCKEGGSLQKSSDSSILLDN